MNNVNMATARAIKTLDVKEESISAVLSTVCNASKSKLVSVYFLAFS
jgi:hypothetical protein